MECAYNGRPRVTYVLALVHLGFCHALAGRKRKRRNKQLVQLPIANANGRG